MSRGRGQGLTTEDGRRAVELARESVRKYVSHGRRTDPGSMRDAFYIRAGAMVRLETADGRSQLRGCASAHDRPAELENGSIQLGNAIVDAAVRAASDSSRGEVRPSELSNLRVSVFTVQESEPCRDPSNEVVVGDHGLAIEANGSQAWMYPTVAIDNDWSVFEYLDRTARKAGLPNGGWEDDDVTVRRLIGQVFEERDPEGTVVELIG